jgi:selenide,water dikinase
VLRAYGVTACTDVTGFGLGGHLQEMLLASGVSAWVDTAALKLLPGAAELASRGIASTLAPDNRAMLALSDQPALAFLVDPQTSGGLLAGVPPERAGACVIAMRELGIDAAVIGRVEPAGAERLRLRSLDGAQRNPG